MRVAEEKSAASVQRPSSRRQESQVTESAGMLAERSISEMASPRVRAPVSPDLRRTEARCARSAMWARSASTGAAKPMILSTVVWAACGDRLGGLARPDPGLDVSRTQGAFHLDLQLADAGWVAAQRGA